ncbi:carbohydrate ABC transporter permease [Cohnella panacarvi]|uniref:carbohydrate ABC transporter permease n=1 Tax=Cohnella panacarvi TaxID=400776 RepID=UPI00047C222E|nr:carbohydrate ABC transporter permease [Cohnella panacarvi]
MYFKNSLIYASGTIAITLVTGSMLAYCLSRMKWKFNSTVLIYISLGLIVPIEVVVIPLFQSIKELHLQESYLGLILPYTGFSLASCVLMLYAFLRSLPKELEEAACIDGTNVYQTFFRIIMPIVLPALVTQSVLVFMRIWNEFPLAFIIASKDHFRPITVGVFDWGIFAASMLLSSYRRLSSI